VLADVSAQLKSVELAESVDDLFARLADAGSLLRIDESIDPQMYRCAIVSEAELEQLRRIKDVVRMGHVKEIKADRVVLDGGSLPIAASALYIDCTAGGLGRGDVATIFAGDRITLQTVRTCQPVFSAALIAHVEAAYADDDTRNALCRPIPNPEVPLDWLRMMLTYNGNQLRWFDEPEMMTWLDSAPAQHPQPCHGGGQPTRAGENHRGAALATAQNQRQARAAPSLTLRLNVGG